jgi:pyridinium-3,5-bisthiocarboxylic acid mononucleotide nickel chelatase
VSDLRGRHLHLDAASGAAGDMTLGALIDLGVPVDVIGAALDAIGAGRQRLQVARVVKGGVAAVDVKVDVGGDDGLGLAHSHAGERLHGHGDHEPESDHGHGPDHGTHHHLKPRGQHGHDHDHDTDPGHDQPDHDHDHSHDHGHEPGAAEHTHVHYREIRARLVAADLAGDVRARALDMFDRVARAEARLHGSTVEDVAFHEVGAIDSIVDIVGTAAALAWLAPTAVTCTSVAMGHGTLRCAHGVLPVPAPAALEILRDAGGVMADGGLPRELCTPTGAAILAHAVTAWAPMPAGTPLAIGWGAGDIDLPDRANVLRAVVLRPAAEATSLYRIEANIDDMSPELCAHAADAAFAAGAVDVWWTPITMKKGRPALLVTALAPTAARDAVATALLRETTSLGVRFDAVERRTLDREVIPVATAYGAIDMKVGRDGGAVVNAAPEFESCRAAAVRTGAPLKAVYAAAIAAWDARKSG